METKTVYRIEHKNEFGIFRSKDKKGNPYNEKLPKTIRRSILDRHINFPTPMKECLNLHNGIRGFYCAFKSINMLNIWFTNKELKAVCKLGFKIYKLEVTEYQIGEFQILFTKESIISKENITEEILGTSTKPQN